MAVPVYPHVYGLWTNKGGVGKTTMSYHLASTYAVLFPDKVVVAIDMCPQANLSSTLLTNESANGHSKVDKLHKSTLVKNTMPLTVGGFFINYVTPQQRLNISPEKWLVNVRNGVPPMFDGNMCMPKNLYLLCGDRSLDLLVEELTKLSNGTVALTNPYKAVHTSLRSYIQDLADHLKQESNKEVVVFIDTNPALSIYTNIALVAMSELIIPVNADCFSMEAIRNMFRLLYGMYPSTGHVVAAYERSMFGFKAKEFEIPVPQITAIVHNRTPVIKEAVAAGGIFKRPKVFRELADSHAGLLFDGYKRASDLGELHRVFLPRAGGPFNRGVGQLQRFSAAYTGTMRDMCSAGVAALHTGIPLWDLEAKKAHIDKTFSVNDITRRLPYLMNDMLIMMRTIFGDSVMNAADASALQRMEALVAEARANGDANDAAQGGAAGANGAGDDDDDDEGGNGGNAPARHRAKAGDAGAVAQGKTAAGRSRVGRPSGDDAKGRSKKARS